MSRLSHISINGFRSIRAMEEPLELRDLNVVIGANGAGKSNLIAFFSMLNYAMSETLQLWVLEELGASAQLYYGAEVTPAISAVLNYTHDDARSNRYAVRLVPGGGERLVVVDETLSYHDSLHYAKPYTFNTERAGFESELPRSAAEAGRDRDSIAIRVIHRLLAGTKVFHFHNTSRHARIHENWQVGDCRYLKFDGGNLAPRLLYLREHQPAYYRRIVEVTRQVAPFFGDFVLEPLGENKATVRVQWTESGSDRVFDGYFLSDGMKRFILLATLLLQPADDLPAVVLIDEPELGLHPAAIHALGAMAHTASQHAQIILTTQSPALLDAFAPDDVIVASRVREGAGPRYETRFERLDTGQLDEWLQEYCLSELWHKNVLGGWPTA